MICQSDLDLIHKHFEFTLLLASLLSRNSFMLRICKLGFYFLHLYYIYSCHTHICIEYVVFVVTAR